MGLNRYRCTGLLGAPDPPVRNVRLLGTVAIGRAETSRFVLFSKLAPVVSLLY